MKKPKYKITISKEQFEKYFSTMTQAALGRKLGISQPCICYHAKKFGLSKSREKRLHFK